MDRHTTGFRIGWYTVNVLIGATMIGPFLWMLLTAVKDAGSVFVFPPELLPRRWEWSNFASVWEAVPFGLFYLNSLFVGIAVTCGQVTTSALAAYAFARLEFPGRDKLFFGYLATMMIPQAVIMIPVFIVLRSLGWIDTYKALILPSIFTAYGTFMLRQFFMSIPRDLEDAARVDGCGPVRILRNVVLPVSKPAIVTLAILTFMATWRSFMWPRIVIHTIEKSTLPIGLQAFQTLHETEYTLLMAGSVMAVIPVIVVFVLGQRAFVKGILLGAVKG